ncbi:NAD-dependent epimerase/dehydratase family protein [Novosphingobium umbonatum]|uniref:NAD-dependent epimerase/dehydratase family protein n=1 Tax=Novosphingobium umbonatum TaxID=1908524 RepID=A0A437N2H9_9SPHN|nr:NAD-dependent epimerase/dehydratase family protein [Novosphingobium umbonatum]RVU04127.1 NAD-dependent epimerase/dehydratase family protein [Novosphingobium umbonatum]
MQVLVTGVAGFIGYSLSLQLLARGDTVIGIDNLNDYYQVSLKQDRLKALREAGGDRFIFLHQDFGHYEATVEALKPYSFSRIVHLGAQAGVRYSIQNPHAYVHSNLAGHLNLLEIGRHRGVEHLVYASSSSVYGGNTQLPFAVEDRVDQPVSLYAATKKADELMSETYAHLFRLPQTGLRFFTVYGPWGRPDMMLWLFTRAMLAGEPIKVFNNGDMYRDFTFIDDIIAGVIASLDNPPADDGAPKAGGSTKPHRIYNIGNHRSEHLMKVVSLLEDALSIKPVIDFQPMQAGDVQATYANIDAIAGDLGYSPTTPIEVGVPKFVEWYRAYHGV